MTDPIFEIVTPTPPKAVEALRGEEGILEAAMFGRNVHVVVDDDREGSVRLEGLLAGRGVSFRSIERVPPSLEDVFVALIQEEGGAVEG
jgi:ABC-2 type transport system ATP-binding protein